MTVRYREATPDDAAAIARLHAESWRATYRGAYPDDYLDGPVWDDRLEVWTTRLTDPPPEQFVAVAIDDDEIVGFACVYGARDEALGSFLDNLHAAPGRHRQGIGRGLMSEVRQWCAEHHPEHGLYLHVLESNINAQAFYERLGATDRGGSTGTAFAGAAPPRIRRYAWDSLSGWPD
jgi:GNAT superfamily N-acetyltransferase